MTDANGADGEGDASERDGRGSDEDGRAGDGGGPTIRRGTERDLLAVLRVLEGAMLDVGANQIRRRTESAEVLVAERDGRVVGALVRDGDHVEAIAVHPDRRGTGIGRALIETALDETDRLTAAFREEVRPFYERLGFDVEERGERLWGERRG
jgi:GNAT superfamily N-acetyltransferase